MKKIEPSTASKNKVDLIKQVKAEYKRTNNIRATARLYKMNRDTVKKYLSIKDIEKEAIYNSSSRYSNLDPYKNMILDKYNEYLQVTKVQSFLKEKGIITKYVTLNHFIKKHLSKYKIVKGSNNTIIEKTITNRSDIIKTVFEWKGNDENISKHIEIIEERYPVITKFKSFYKQFKTALVNLDYKSIEIIFNTDFENTTINKFLYEARKDDYEAIINASKFKFNNGILEGTVNKIKNIKKVMYGRCSVELLTAKVLYQSNNYH